MGQLYYGRLRGAKVPIKHGDLGGAHLEAQVQRCTNLHTALDDTVPFSDTCVGGAY